MIQCKKNETGMINKAGNRKIKISTCGSELLTLSHYELCILNFEIKFSFAKNKLFKIREGK